MVWAAARLQRKGPGAVGRDELGISIEKARSAEAPKRIAADFSFARPASPAAKRRRHVRRQSARSTRAHGADMHRSAFLTLVACWGAGLVTLLALVIVIRVIG